MKKEEIVQMIAIAHDSFNKADYDVIRSTISTIRTFLESYNPDGSLTSGTVKDDTDYLIFLTVQITILEGNVFFRLGDFDKALNLFENAVEIAEKTNDVTLQGRAVGNIGSIYLYYADYDKALDYYNKSLILLEGTDRKIEYANVLGNVGNVYVYRSEYSEGLKYLKKSLHILEEMGSLYESARTLANIGILYFNIEDYKHALEYLEKAFRMFDFTWGDPMYAIICTNLANTYLNLNNNELALRYYEMALEFAETIGHKAEMATIMGNIGFAYSKTGNYDKALDCFKKGLAISEEINDAAGIGFNLAHMGVVLSKPEYPVFDAEFAEKYLLQALSVFERIGNRREIYECHKDLSSLLKVVKKWEDFAYHLEKYHEVKQDVMNTTMKSDAEHFLREREDEFKRREREILVEKNIALQEANIFKTKLLGIAAHDLKNPLGNIIGAAQVVLKEIDNRETALEWLSVIEESAKRMNQMILELLESSAATLGAMELKISNSDINEIISIAIKQHDANLGKKAQVVEYNAEGNCIIKGDENKLFQVFDNLISNASKYSYLDSKIYVTVTHHNQSIRITVRDEGQGMTPEDLTKIFGQFQRLSATPTAGENSTGLGLNIVKHIVELHGGKIWAESKGQGLGTTFFVELPL